MTNYGCYNRVIVDSFLAQDGYKAYSPTGTDLIHHSSEYYMVPRFVETPFRMSRECKYDQNKTDARCSGCRLSEV